MKKEILTILLTILPILASAETVEIDGIYYNLVLKARQAEVASNPTKYKGNVSIPKKVIHEGVEYAVKKIADNAFHYCSGLTSVTIPESVSSIGEFAFSGCSGLTSVTIPNSVTSISRYAFQNCIGLKSITIPNSVTSIGNGAFSGCSGLTSVTIPNSVTSIDFGVFGSCSSLTSVTIPNSVTSLGQHAFSSCSGLTSIMIPNSVTLIDSFAFQSCSGLTSVTIGSGVIKIGNEVFASCTYLTDVYCMAENVPSTKTTAFDGSYVEFATLHVPASSINAYTTTAPWSSFGTIEALSGDSPGMQKCATPTINFVDRKVKLSCETEGVEYVSEVIVTDAKKYYDSEFSLSQTYLITAYATKAGYENSDVATASLCWIDAEPKMEGVTNSVISVRAQAVLIQSNGNQLTISGADEGTIIDVYDTTGKQVGYSMASAETTTINTSLHSGEIGIVKIGNKSVKVIIK